MQRFVPIAVAAVILTAGIALAPTSAQAQSGYYRNDQTATGNSWMNENDYDYNRQHMTPPNRATNRSQNYDKPNNYGSNNGYDRNYQNDNNGGYDRNYDQNRSQRRSNDYGQDRNDDQRGYDPRYDQGYNQRQYNSQQGYGRYQQPNYDDQD